MLVNENVSKLFIYWVLHRNWKTYIDSDFPIVQIAKYLPPVTSSPFAWLVQAKFTALVCCLTNCSWKEVELQGINPRHSLVLFVRLSFMLVQSLYRLSLLKNFFCYIALKQGSRFSGIRKMIWRLSCVYVLLNKILPTGTASLWQIEHRQYDIVLLRNAW